MTRKGPEKPSEVMRRIGNKLKRQEDAHVLDLPGVEAEFARAEAAKKGSDERKAAIGTLVPSGDDDAPSMTDNEFTSLFGTDWTNGLAEAQQLSKRLDEQTDLLTSAIKHVEQKLTLLKLGVRAEVFMDGKEGARFYRKLVFCKESGQWRLMIESGDADAEQTDEWLPLIQASRRVRLQAVIYFPPLLQEMIKNVKAELRIATSQTNEASKFAAALGEFTRETK